MSTHQTSQGAAGLSPEETELVKAELDRIVGSQGFRRSPRHARFLRFVCEATLNGESVQLNEYLIAHSVFDRGTDYSPGEDSVVRRQAYTLRQKLQDYYTSDGASDPVRIELPVGRYIPTFQFRDQSSVAESPEEVAPRPAPVVPPPPAAAPEPRSAAAQSQSKWIVMAVAGALIFAALGWFAGVRSQRASVLDPVFSRIWGPLLSSSEGSVICFSNALTAGIRRTEVPFPEGTLTSGILLREQEADIIRKQFHLPPGGYFYINPALAHAKMGEAMGSVPLTAMFTKAGTSVRATQSRYLNWQDFRRQNLILLGHDEANQWLDPILGKLPFRQAHTTAEKPRRIIVAEPHRGERAE